LKILQEFKNKNAKKISIVIGNPPYNANQESENDNNRNRSYKAIDLHIKNTYVRYSNAQKSKVYDPYSRFFRWATNRLDNNGILAFIRAPRKISAFQCFCGHEKAANLAAKLEVLISTIDDIT
jgi:predicted helicase